MKGRLEMLARLNQKTAAVLSGVTASLLFAVSAASAQDRPVVVYAEPDENVRTERISYADLDLALQRDERTLHARVAKAVRRVCLFDKGSSGLQDSSYFSCTDEAKAGAAPQIAQAVARANQIALTGKSSIAATAITISVPVQ
jgi:UrcA family protein